MSIVELIFGLSGLTIIMSAGSIFENLRNFILQKNSFLGELVSCPMCLGFWVGLFFGFATMTYPPIILAGMVSLFSWMIFNFVDLLMTASAYITHLLSEKMDSDSNNTIDNADSGIEEESRNNEHSDVEKE